MTANERALRGALRNLLSALDRYAEERFFGSDSDDDDSETHRAAERLDKVAREARRVMKDTGPKPRATPPTPQHDESADHPVT